LNIFSYRVIFDVIKPHIYHARTSGCINPVTMAGRSGRRIQSTLHLLIKFVILIKAEDERMRYSEKDSIKWNLSVTNRKEVSRCTKKKKTVTENQLQGQ
jgi:hypothetical protein